MSVPVYDFPNETKKFVEQGLWKGKKQFGPATAIGFATQSEGIVAGIVYHNFDPDAKVIEISAYSNTRTWLNRDNLKRIFDYPFNQLNNRLVIARCGERNHRVRRIWNHLGADEFSIPKLRNENEAEIVMTLEKVKWKNSKYMRKRHGKT